MRLAQATGARILVTDKWHDNVSLISVGSSLANARQSTLSAAVLLSRSSAAEHFCLSHFRSSKMKTVSALFVLLMLSGTAMAAKDCEELKSEIATKLDAKGVQNYQLEIVEPADVADRQQVGSCGGGTKRIVYTRGVAKSVAE